MTHANKKRRQRAQFAKTYDDFKTTSAYEIDC